MAISLRLIVKCVAEYFGTSEIELRSERRPRHLTRQRQAYYWLARELTGRSTTVIGRAMGARDHTTVIYHLKEMDQIVAGDASVRTLLEELKLIVIAADKALERLGIVAPGDLDPVEIAERLMNTPLARLHISTEELQALGAAVLNMHETIVSFGTADINASSNGL